MASKHGPGPFLEYFFIPEARIHRIACETLVSLELMPDSPGPVRIERYCEKRWGFSEDYVHLPKGVLGKAKFSEGGLDVIQINRELSEDSSEMGNIRTRSTLAHEIGHGELHSGRYAEKIRHERLQGESFEAPMAARRIIETACRKEQIFRFQKDEWWEIQANKFMAAVLMPKHLLRQVFDEWNADNPPETWPPLFALDDVIADTFKVSQTMAGIAARSLREIEAKECAQAQKAVSKPRK
jgi:Zn-dependent peptidase ImmA (M78 family)